MCAATSCSTITAIRGATCDALYPSPEGGGIRGSQKIQRVDAEAAEQDSPPGEDGERMPLHEAEKRLHDDPAEDEREEEADGDRGDIAAMQEVGAALVG